MSYTKREWATGNVVGAVDLNRIENGIADIDVDEICGWSMQNTQLFSETVTTTASDYGNEGQLVYTTSETPPESLQITFDGTDYDCARQEMGGTVYYGAPDPSDFSTYPFIILFDEDTTYLYTQSAGTYTVAAQASFIQTSADFNKAVNQCVDVGAIPFQLIPNETNLDDTLDAMNSGRLLYFWAEVDFAQQCFIVTRPSTTCTILPESSAIAAKFGRDDGVFYIQTL